MAQASRPAAASAFSSIVQRSFGSGEVAPAYHGRADTNQFLSGLRTCRNFMVQRGGGIRNRAGFRYVGSTKDQDPTDVQLMPYISEVAGESVLIECGLGYFRFFRLGAPVEVTMTATVAWSGATAYLAGDMVLQGGLSYICILAHTNQVPPNATYWFATAWSNATAYVAGDIIQRTGINYYCILAHTNQVPPNATYWYPLVGDLLEIPHPFTTELPNWSQSGRVITLTHQNRAPYELVYADTTRWVVQLVTTAAWSTGPVGLAAVAGAAGTRTFSYRVTAGALATYEESLSSGATTVAACAAPTLELPITVSWTALAGAVEYYIYADPFQNGVFGLVGTSVGLTSFRDTGAIPDFGVAYPLPVSLFAAPFGYPNYSTTFQQRRVFAHTIDDPDFVWASRTGFRSNFAISSPLQDDDSISFRISDNQFHPVRQMFGLKQGLVVLTDRGEWVIRGSDGIVISPSSLDAAQEGYSGGSSVKGVVVGKAIIYLQARGTQIHALQFGNEQGGFDGRDMTLYAQHLFDGYEIVSMEYQQIPDSIIWAVRSDGTLLGMTYIRDDDTFGWHRHDTGASGLFKQVCVVPELDEDVLYALVQRTINGADVLYIESLERRTILDFDVDCFFVDSGLSYNGAAATTISGLDHLEGEVVAVVANGAVIYNGDPTGADAADFTVTAGTIAGLLPSSTNIHAGLAIRYAEIETLDLDVGGTDLRDKQKRVGTLAILVDKSSRGFSAGPDTSHLFVNRLRPYEGNVDESSGRLEISLTSTFSEEGRIVIRQTDPLPLTLLGVIPNVQVGG